MRLRVLVLGAAGGFGRLLSSLLTEEGYEVVGSDTAPDPGPDSRLDGYVRADVHAPGDDLRQAVREADWVMACLPADAAMAAFTELSPEMRPGALFLDILSVKGPICTLMEAGRTDVECISIHPMFAPSLEFLGQNVAMVQIRPGPHTGVVEHLLLGWGAKVHHLTAQQHDRSTAAIQAATHAAVIAYGLALAALGYRTAEALPISTPPHRTLLALLARVASGNPGVYWQIQSENPLAEDVRRQLAAGAEHLQRLVAANDQRAFSEMMSGLRALVDDAGPGLPEFAARVLATPYVTPPESSSLAQPR